MALGTTATWFTRFVSGQGKGRTTCVRYLIQDEVATLNMVASMESLLYDYDVAGVWSGHVHAYERTHKAYKGERDVK